MWNSKTQGRTINYINEHRSKLHYLLDELTTTDDSEGVTTTAGKKKGYRSTTITGDYDMEIAVSSTSRGGDYYSHRSTGNTTGWLCLVPLQDRVNRYDMSSATTALMTRQEAAAACGAETTSLQAHFRTPLPRQSQTTTWAVSWLKDREVCSTGPCTL